MRPGGPCSPQCREKHSGHRARSLAFERVEEASTSRKKCPSPSWSPQNNQSTDSQELLQKRKPFQTPSAKDLNCAMAQWEEKVRIRMLLPGDIAGTSRAEHNEIGVREEVQCCLENRQMEPVAMGVNAFVKGKRSKGSGRGTGASKNRGKRLQRTRLWCREGNERTGWKENELEDINAAIKFDVNCRNRGWQVQRNPQRKGTEASARKEGKLILLTRRESRRGRQQRHRRIVKGSVFGTLRRVV